MLSRRTPEVVIRSFQWQLVISVHMFKEVEKLFKDNTMYDVLFTERGLLNSAGESIVVLKCN